jgi:hypothetical protein
VSRRNEILERLRSSRTAVSGSPFYTPEQKEAVAFVLDLIEFGEARPDAKSKDLSHE